LHFNQSFSVRFTDFNLDPRVNEGIDAMGYESPTPIQEQVIPIILDGRDLIATAQTGTGKTAAFLLPLIHKVITGSDQEFTVTALIIAPTRELVQQIDQQLNGMGYFSGISSIAVFGGGESAGWDVQKRAIIRGVDVLVATPGRLISHLNMGYVDLSKVKYLILDEADRMLDMGFIDDIMNIISHLPKQRQTMMFSATMPQDIRKLASAVLTNPTTISLALTRPAEGVLQAVYSVHDSQKPELIRRLLSNRELNTVLVFSATKSNVKLVATQLQKAGLSVSAIHSDLEQAQREQVLLDFRNRKLKVLVATDVLSRGIDIDGIDLVINYDVPQDAEDYVHRVGRTARAENTGLAITFVSGKEARAFQRIESLIGTVVRRMPLPEGMGDAPDLPVETRGSRPRGSERHKPGKGGKSRHHRGKPRNAGEKPS
jgi:superfamily II DNA/RNA helicase